MKATTSQKVKIGIFTIVGIVVLFAGIYSIGNKRNIFDRTFVIYGVFKNVGGLQVGNNVRFVGINVGTVVGINIENDSSVKVVMRLKENVHRFLKDDAMASIGTDGLMGDKLVNISPGPGSIAALEKGGRINTALPVDFDKIINKVYNVASNAEVITSSLADISRQISSGQGSLGKLIYTDTLERGLVGTVKSVHATVNSMDATVSAAHEALDSAKKGVVGFQQNMDAMKHNFLLKGYYRKKAKREQRDEQHKEQNAQ